MKNIKIPLVWPTPPPKSPSCKKQIAKLADYILANHADDITGGGAVDDAIELLKRLPKHKTTDTDQAHNILDSITRRFQSISCWDIRTKNNKFLITENFMDGYSIINHNEHYSNGIELINRLAKDPEIAAVIADPKCGG